VAVLAALGAGAFLVVVRALAAGGILGHHPSDGTRQAYFVREFVLTSIAAGRLPLWNPYTQFGEPFFANIQWAVFYPLNVLFLPFPISAAYNLFIAFHLAVAGVGMYLLARSWGVTVTGASIAALGYMLSGRLVAYAWGGVVNMLSATVWLPLVLLMFSRAVLDPGRRRVWWALATTMLLALQVLSGHPQETFFTVFVLLSFALWEAAHRRHSGAGFAAAAVPLGIGIVSVVGAACVAAVQLIPTYEATRLSTRNFDWAITWPRAPVFGAYNPLRLLTWVVPDVFGNAVSLPPASTDWLSLVLHEAHSNEFQGYIGVVPLILAICALGEWRARAHVRFLWILVGVSLLLALGHFTPVYGLVYAGLPPLRTFRVPARFLSVIVFATALLGGFGADALRRRSAPVLRRWAIMLALVALVLAAECVIGLVAHSSIRDVGGRLSAGIFAEGPSGSRLPPGERRALIDDAYWLAIGAASRSAVFVAAASAVLFTGAGRRRRMVGGALIALTGIDLGLHALSYTGFERMPELMSQHGRLLEIIRRTDAEARSLAVPALEPSADVIQPNENAFMHHRLLSAGGYDPFELVTYRNVLDVLVADLRRASTYTPSVFGVRFVVTPLALANERLTVVGALNNSTMRATIYENRDALPRYYFVTSARTVKDAASALAAIRARDFRLGEEVLIESATLPAPPVPVAAGQGAVRMLAASPARLVLDVAAPMPGWLVVNDTFFPGIVATLDERPVEVVRANGLVRAVAVPAGRHRVDMMFRPRTLWLGAAISLSTILLGVGVCTMYGRHRGEE
jgi:hypothetical protein